MTLENTNLSSFCILPWRHFYIGNNGAVADCCESQRASKDFLKFNNSDSNAFDLKTIWNSTDRKKVRREMLSGIKPMGCMGCFKEEAKGGESYRISSNKEFENELANSIADTHADGALPIDIRWADFRLGRDCNLACRMCNPFSTSKLIHEWTDLEIPFQGLEGGENNYDWYKSKDFYKDFFEKNSRVEVLTIAGGEVLFNPIFSWLIEYLVESKKSQKIDLIVHTNATYLNQKLLDLFVYFRSIKLRLSIDGVGAVNSYIRHHSKWDQIDNNLKSLNSWARFPFTKVYFNTTVQAYNLLDLSNIYKYSLTFENFKPIKFSILTSPDYFSFSILPLEIRELAAMRIGQLIEDFQNLSLPVTWNQFSMKESKRRLEKMKARILGENTPSLLQSFINSTVVRDTYRQQNVQDYIPELAPLFNGNKKAHPSYEAGLFEKKDF